MKRKMVIGMLTMGMVLCGAMTVSAESDGYVISASHGYGAVEHWEIKTIGMQDAAKILELNLIINMQMGICSRK